MQHTSPPSSPPSHILDEQPRMNLDLQLQRQEIENAIIVSPDSVIPNITDSTNKLASKGAPKGDKILHPQPWAAVRSDIDITPLAPPPSDVNLPLPSDNDDENDATTVNILDSQDENPHEHDTEPQPSPALSHDEENTPIIIQQEIHQDEPAPHFNADPASVEQQFDTTSEPTGDSAPADVDINAIEIPPFNPTISHPDADVIPPTSTQLTSSTSPPVNVDANDIVIPQFNSPALVNVNLNGDIIPAPAPNPQFDPTAPNMFAFMDDGGVGAEFFEHSTSTPIRHRPGAPHAGQGHAEDEMEVEENRTGETGHEFLFNEYELDSPDANNSNGNSMCGLQEGRVEASKMGQVDNPLQKRGRHTVITGHLPENNPYAIAEKNLGVKMCSLKWAAATVVGLSKEEAFARDLQQFLVEIHLTGYKVPVIGGGPLDLFALMREVLLLGGVTNVVKKRAFRIVGQQLELPKSCTSAAFVLKNAYTRLLFYYERKLVFDEMPPENPVRNVNIKQIVAADKEREKMQAKSRNFGRGSGSHIGNNNMNMDLDGEINMNMAIGNGFRGCDDKKRNLIMMNTTTTPGSPSPESLILDNGYEEREACAGPLKRARYRYSTSGAKVDNNNVGENEANNMAEITPMGSAVDYQFSQEYYMSLVSNYPPPSAVSNMTMNEGINYQHQYSLPEWAKSKVSEQNYAAFVDAAHALDDRHEGEIAFSNQDIPLGASFASSASNRNNMCNLNMNLGHIAPAALPSQELFAADVFM